MRYPIVVRRSPLVSAFLVASLLAMLAGVPGGPLGVDPALARAPEGRLVVRWRGTQAPSTAVAGVARTSHAPGTRRSLVVTEPGRTLEVAARLLADPRVDAVIADSRATAVGFPQTAPNDPSYAGSQPDLPLLGVPAAWTTTLGAGATVAVLDTGLDVAHPDLAGTTIVDARNFVSGSADVGTATVTDVVGHGTHVSGTIAATTDNGIGVAGIAPGAALMPVKVLDDTGSGWFSDILDGIDWAVAHHADVVSMSLGGSLVPDAVAFYQPSIDAAFDAGVVLVAAAGNDGSTTLSYPASFNHVISVAATGPASDPIARDARASYSQHNALVDVAAPGTAVYSTYPGAQYAWMSGTSMATPHVAAAAALLAAAHPAWTPQQVENALESTAIDLATPGRDDEVGWGRIRADLALAASPGTTPLPTPTPTPSPTASPTPTPSPSAAPTASPSPTPSPSPTAAPTASPSPSPSPSSTASPTPSPTATPTPDPTSTPAPTGTPTPTSTPAPTATPSPTPVPDTTRPRVSAVYPAPRTTGISRDATARVVFSEPVRGTSSTRVRLVNTRNGLTVSVAWRYDPARRTVYLDPKLRLWSRTTYRIVVRSGITDAAGNPVVTVSTTFTTRP